jgi:YVTN family beta-propeller protein
MPVQVSNRRTPSDLHHRLRIGLFCACVAVTLAACDESTPIEPVTMGPPGRLYVANQTDSTIYVYDTETLTRVDSFPAQINQPHFIKFSPDHSKFYMISRDFNGRLARFNTATNSLEAAAALPGLFPTSIAITPDGLFGYVCDFSAAGQETRVYKVNLQTLSIVDSISAGASTHDVDITSDGSIVVATNMSDVITMIYTDADTVHPVSIDPDSVYAVTRQKYMPYGLTIDHRDSLAYIACLDHHEVHAQVRVLDLALRQIVDSFYLPIDHIAAHGDPAGPTLVELSPDDAYLYVTTQWDNSIIILRLATRTVFEYPVEVGRTFGVTATDDGSRVYVTAAGVQNDFGRVYVIDGKTRNLIDSLNVGRNPFGIRWRPL